MIAIMQNNNDIFFINFIIMLIYNYSVNRIVQKSDAKFMSVIK
jgi:hypothetical protein